MDTLRSRSEGPGLLHSVDWRIPEEGPSSANEKKKLEETPPITISVRLIPYVDVGQMRVHRRRLGSNDQDKDLG